MGTGVFLLLILAVFFMARNPEWPPGNMSQGVPPSLDDERRGNVYSNSKYGFTFEYPVGWKENSRCGNVTFDQDDTRAVIAPAPVIAQCVTDMGLDLSDRKNYPIYVGWYNESPCPTLPTTYSAYTIRKRMPLTVGSWIRAVSNSGDFNDESGRHKFREVFFENPSGQCYTIFSIKDTDSELGTEIWSQIISTFRFTADKANLDVVPGLPNVGTFPVE